MGIRDTWWVYRVCLIWCPLRTAWARPDVSTWVKTDNVGSFFEIAIYSVCHHLNTYCGSPWVPPWWRLQIETFSTLLAFVRGLHGSPVNSLHNGQWRGALMFFLICAWINAWVNTRKAGDLRRHLAHYDVIVMTEPSQPFGGIYPWLQHAEVDQLPKPHSDQAWGTLFPSLPAPCHASSWETYQSLPWALQTPHQSV